MGLEAPGRCGRLVHASTGERLSRREDDKLEYMNLENGSKIRFQAQFVSVSILFPTPSPSTTRGGSLMSQSDLKSPTLDWPSSYRNLVNRNLGLLTEREQRASQAGPCCYLWLGWSRRHRRRSARAHGRRTLPVARQWNLRGDELQSSNLFLHRYEWAAQDGRYRGVLEADQPQRHDGEVPGGLRGQR